MYLKSIRHTLQWTEQQPGKLTRKATTGAEASAQLGNICIAVKGQRLPQQDPLYQILNLTERRAIKSPPCLQHKWHPTTNTLNLHRDVHTDKPGDCACCSANPARRRYGCSAVSTDAGCETHLEASNRGHASSTDRMHVDEIRRSMADSTLFLLI